MEQRIGRYQILEEIASGGQGTVYRAFDPDTRQIIAVKVLHPTLSGDRGYIERFRREASLAASIDHPNVVKIFEVGQDDDRHFMALEFLPESLARVIQTGPQMPIGTAAQFGVEVADGLMAAHALGIVHRDVKPQNVLIGPDGTAKVTDFGIARAESLSTMTATGVVMGTPHYMSPEQSRGERADARSDVYSLGCMVYQMLAGEVPFKGDTPLAVLRQQIDEQPRRLRELRRDLPRRLEGVVERSMAKDPGRRYQSTAEMAQALRDAVPGLAGPARAAAPRPRPTTPTPQPPESAAQPEQAPQQPSRTWMSAWANAWQRSHRRRWAWIGTLLSITVALTVAGVRLGAYDRARDYVDEAGWFGSAAVVEQPTQPIQTGSTAVPIPTTTSIPVAVPFSTQTPAPADLVAVTKGGTNGVSAVGEAPLQPSAAGPPATATATPTATPTNSPTAIPVPTATATLSTDTSASATLPETFNWPPLGDGQSYVLTEDFGDKTLQGGSTDPGYRIVATGTDSYLRSSPQRVARVWWPELSLPREFLVRLRFRVNSVGSDDWLLAVNARVQVSDRPYFDDDGYIWLIRENAVSLGLGPGASRTDLHRVLRTTTPGSWHTFEARFEDGLINSSIDGVTLGSAIADDKYVGGILSIAVSPGSELDFDDIQVVEKFSWPPPGPGETLAFEEDFADQDLGVNSLFNSRVEEEAGNRFLFVPESSSGWGPSEVLTNQRVSFRFKPTNPNPGSFEILSLTTHYSPDRIGRYHVYIWSDAIRFLEGGRPEAETLATHAVRITPGVWHLMTVTVIDGRFIVTLDGEQVIDHFDDRFESGTTFFQQTEASYYIDDFQLVRLPNPVPAPDSLVSWWPGDGNANDIAGANHGTLEGGAGFAPGVVGEAFSFDGVGDYANIGDIESIDALSTITVDAWIRSNSDSSAGPARDYHGFVSKCANVGGCTGWTLGVISHTYARVWIRNGPRIDLGGLSDIIDRNWHHIAFTYDGSTVSLYVDGNLEKSESFSGGFPSTENDLSIGGENGSGLFDGLIDEVRIFDKALSESEIRAIFDEGSAGMIKHLVPTATLTPPAPAPTVSPTPTATPSPTATPVPTAAATLTTATSAPGQADCLTLTSGCSIQGKIDFLGEVDWYTFDAQADDAVFIVLVEGEGMEFMRLELFDAQGNAVASTHSFGGTTTATIDTSLKSAGQYTVRVRHDSGAIGPYTLSFYQRSKGGGVSLESNSSSPGEISLPGEVDWYTFKGEAGDVVFIVLVEGEGMEFMRLELFDAQGNAVASTHSFGGTTTATIDTSLKSAGQYTVRVRHDSGAIGPYTLSFNKRSP